MAESYFELLRRPEWQRKRLDVMQAAGFACGECLATDKTLNVHHRYYRKGAKPWEYPDDAFACLCEPCHQRHHELLDEAKKLLGFLSTGYLESALGYIKGQLLWAHSRPGTGGSLPRDADGFVRVRVGTEYPTESFGMGDAWNLRHIEYASLMMDLSGPGGVGVGHDDLYPLWAAQVAELSASFAATHPEPGNTMGGDCRA